MSLNIEKKVQGSNPENRKKENSNAYLFWGKSPLYFKTSENNRQIQKGSDSPIAYGNEGGEHRPTSFAKESAASICGGKTNVQRSIWKPSSTSLISLTIIITLLLLLLL